MVEAAARNPSTEAITLLSAAAAHMPIQVMAASAMNQSPIAGKATVGLGKLPLRNAHWSKPKPIQNEPQVPCMAVATASRALNDHMPALNWAMPPKTAANGTR